ncbi:hypothetical protein E8E13_010802 [Curvularia kusanoi]|uniref:Uncharacterized protein n=1 Tax=Curvularia kusanoi TaxID=90978 RepID=A0A9P4TKH7_CURKU|nr:hypothetical protein E8E13_010802 [Curvularia kusanoi]
MHPNNILLFLALCLSSTTEALVIPETKTLSSTHERRSSFGGRLYDAVARSPIIEAISSVTVKREPLFVNDIEARGQRRPGGSKRSDDIEARGQRRPGGGKRSDDIEARGQRRPGGSKRSDDIEARGQRRPGGSKRSDDIEARGQRRPGGSKRSDDIEARGQRRPGGSKRSGVSA